MFLFRVSLLIVSLLLIQQGYGAEEFKVIQTDGGQVRGKSAKTLLNKRTFYSFRGIPYAKPPVGELRFKAPEKLEPWAQVRDALDYGNECVQHSFLKKVTSGEEDCLTVNVFTPDVSPATAYPVIFFIHGGGYFAGSGRWYGPEFLLDEDVVLVTFNYRVGPLGFLTLNSPEYSGNNGLKDQRLALEWVHKNIHHFGGDNKKITVYGQSAGANAAHLHLALPQTRKLIRRAILSSGSALVPWSFSPLSDHSGILQQIAARSGAPARSQKDLIQFLKGVDAKALTKQTYQPLYTPGFSSKEIRLLWAPVVENKRAVQPIVTDPPEVLLNARQSQSSVDTIFGFNSLEAYFLAALEFVQPQSLDTFDKGFFIQLPFRNAKYNYSTDVYQGYSDEIRDYYFADGSIQKNIPAFVDLLSDVFFNYGTVKAAKAQSKSSSGKTYFYKFTADTKLNFVKKLSTQGRVPPLAGSTHADELGYIFKAQQYVPEGSYTGLQENSKEAKIIKRMTKIVASFANNGIPTDDSKSTVWKPIDNSGINFVNITNDGLVADVNPNQKNIEFWDEFLAKHKGALAV